MNISQCRLGIGALMLMTACEASDSPPGLPLRTDRYISLTGVGRTSIQDAADVSFTMLESPERADGLRWSRTGETFDRQTAFRGPCIVHVTMPDDRTHSLEAVGGLLTQREDRIVHALLYLTGPPVDLQQALALIEKMGAAFEIRNHEELRNYLGRIRAEQPTPGFGRDYFANIPVAEAVELGLALKSSYEDKGWYVQASVRESDPD